MVIFNIQHTIKISNENKIINYATIKTLPPSTYEGAWGTLPPNSSNHGAKQRGHGGPFPQQLVNRLKRQRQRPIHIIHIHYPPIFVIQRYAQFLNIHRSKIFTASV